MHSLASASEREAPEGARAPRGLLLFPTARLHHPQRRWCCTSGRLGRRADVVGTKLSQKLSRGMVRSRNSNWPRWIRTTIPRSKVWCPAVGRGASGYTALEVTSRLGSAGASAFATGLPLARPTAWRPPRKVRSERRFEEIEATTTTTATGDLLSTLPASVRGVCL